MSNAKDLYVRPYRTSDLPIILPIIEREIPLLPTYGGVSVSREKVKFLLEMNKNNIGTFMFSMLARKDNDEAIGGVAGYAVPLLFSEDVTTCDIFLYIRPEYRGITQAMMLVRRYLEWAKERKPKLIQASHTGGHKETGMGRLLESVGFKPVGTLYHLKEGEAK